MDAFREKNKSFVYDYLIVGQGLAGTILAIQLIKAGCKIAVIDNPSLSASSRVAAGIWNPVVFKRLTKSWMADQLVPALLEFYSEFEQENKVKVFQNRSIIKPFSEEQEKTLWLKKSLSENAFLENKTYESLALTDSVVLSQYSNVLNAGNLDVVLFLETARKYIAQHAPWHESVFDYDQLQSTGTGIVYQDIQAADIIFAEGHLISQNPYFNWVPMKPAKGEVLTILCNDLKLEKDIVNKGIFILPLGDHRFKVGATYQWNDFNDMPTDEAREELVRKLANVIKVPFEIVKHEAGVRPSVIDRRPLMGVHPKQPHYWIFNGFGTKGVMLVPYFAAHFVKCLKGEQAIIQEVDVARFFKD